MIDRGYDQVIARYDREEARRRERVRQLAERAQELADAGQPQGRSYLTGPHTATGSPSDSNPHPTSSSLHNPPFATPTPTRAFRQTATLTRTETSALTPSKKAPRKRSSNQQNRSAKQQPRKFRRERVYYVAGPIEPESTKMSKERRSAARRKARDIARRERLGL